MRGPRVVYVTSFANVHLDIYVIGYPKQGESIVAILKDGDRPIYCAVTDSYLSDDQINYTERILTKCHIETIDDFLWTHPDEDHSKGIVQLLKNFSKSNKTHVFLPEGLNKAKSSEEEIKYLMSQFDKNRKYSYAHINVETDEEIRDIKRLKLIDSSNSNVYSFFKLSFLLPNASVSARTVNETKKFEPNDISLVYCITYNGFYYLFGGDMMNKMVQFLPNNNTELTDTDFVNRIRYIKIPHHSSNNTEKLVSYFKRNNLKDAVSVTTIFKKERLPKKSIIDEYCDMSSYVGSTDTGDCPYGHILTSFSTNSDFIGHKAEGNAKEIKVDNQIITEDYLSF